MPPSEPLKARERIRAFVVRRWPELALVALVVIVAVTHTLWLQHFRRGLPLDIDEAGYLGFAHDDLRGWRLDGLAGFFDASIERATFAPLVPMLAAPLLAMFGGGAVPAMAVQLLFVAILAAAVYGIGVTLHGRLAGFFAASLSMLIPGVFDFSRTFHFVIASTAFLSLATLALLRSDRLQHRGWMLLFGAAVGLMLLSRTVTLAFLPGLGAVVIVLAWRAGRERLRRTLSNLALGGVAFLAVSGWWYVPNLGSVVDYLTGQGYGSEFTIDFPSSPLEIRFWTARLAQLIGVDTSPGGLHLLPSLVIATAFAVHLVRRRRRRRESTSPPPARAPADVGTLVASPAGIVTVLVLVTYFVLTSSPDPGTGFIVPLTPLVLALGVSAVLSLDARLRLVLMVALVASITVAAIGKTTVSGPLAAPRCIDVPALGCLVISEGRGPVMEPLASRGIDTLDPDAAREGAARGWVDATREAALRLHEIHGDAPFPPIVVFGSRDPYFNTNTVGLAWRRQRHAPFLVGQLLSFPGHDSVLHYLRQLARPELGQPTLLVSAETGAHEYRPIATQRKVVEAARCLGFVRASTFRLPDGRRVDLYHRTTALPTAVSRQDLRELLDRCREEGPPISGDGEGGTALGEHVAARVAHGHGVGVRTGGGATLLHPTDSFD